MTFLNEQDNLIESICQNSIHTKDAIVSFLSSVLINFDQLSDISHYNENLITNLLLFYQYLITNNNIIPKDVLNMSQNQFSLFSKYLIKNKFIVRN